MTAQVTVLGNGRVLHHRELVGRSLCYFLTVTFAGRTFRWAFPSARDVWVEEVDGDVYHFQGMDYPQMSQSFDFDSDSPVDISVSFEDLTFPGDVDLPELLAEGHRLERCEAELSALPDHPDSLWSERQIVLLGEVREPVYGDPETHANTVGFTVDSPSWEDTSLFPPDDWVVTEEAWPDAHENAIGKVFPFVFGTPGFIANPLGVREAKMGSPGLQVRLDRYMFAGHIVAPNTYDTGIFTTQTFWDVTSSQTLQGVGSAPVLELATTTSGFQYTDANFNGEPGYTSGDEIWISAWAVRNLTNTLAEERSLGGYPNFEWDGPLITAGDVLYFMLLQSSLKVDRGRTAVAQALLQSYRVSGYIDERVSPYEWITDNLLPILPIAMSQGPKGVFPIVWRYDAGPTDCVGSFIEGPRWRRVSSVERDDSNILNKYTLSYGLDGSDFLLKFGVDGALEENPDTSETGATYVPNLYARRSFLEHGTIAVDESSDIVTTQDTAAQICAWKIRANALSKRTVTYEATAEHAWLEPGDPILVTDPDLFFDEQVCLVRTKTWDVTSVLYELLILTDPVREQVVVEEDPLQDLIDAAEATGTLVGFWIVNDGDATIVDDETIMEDVTATSASVMKAQITNAGTWTRDTTDAPTGFPGCVKTTARSSAGIGDANYMGMDAACASSETVILFARVETVQGTGEYTNLGGVGTFASPNGVTNNFAVWSGGAGSNKVYMSGDGGGSPGMLIPHSDYSDWVVIAFTRSPQTVYASHVGGTWKDMGSYSPGATWASGWTGFSAFCRGGSTGREEGVGTVKHAGFMFFSSNLSDSDLQSLLIAGGIITA